MKRLLLSTALILGALTEGKGATLDGLSLKADEMQQQVQALQNKVTTAFDGLSSKTDELQQQVQALQDEIAALKTGAAAADEGSRDLKNDVIAIQTTLQQLVPHTSPTISLDSFAIHTAYTNLDRVSAISTLHAFDNNAITQLHNIVYSSSLNPNELDRLKKRVTIAEQAILECFNQIIDHKEWTIIQLFTFQNKVIFATCVLLNVLICFQYIFLGHTPYPSVSPMTGGVTIMSLNNFVMAWAAKLQSDTLSKIQIKWRDKLSNPEVKSYISSLLALEFVGKNIDFTPKSIQRKLESAMSQKCSFAELRP